MASRSSGEEFLNWICASGWHAAKGGVELIRCDHAASVGVGGACIDRHDHQRFVMYSTGSVV